ncbi:MAG: DsbA family protein [Galactobacter sp.]
MASNSPRPNKAERLQAAREAARAKREAAEKQRRRKAVLVRWSVVVIVIAVIAAIAGIYYFNVYKPSHQKVATSGAVPAHGNQYGGVVLTGPKELADSPEDTPKTVSSKGLATDANDAAAKGLIGEDIDIKASGAESTSGKPKIIIYADVICPYCKQFEDQYGQQLETWLEDGDVEVEYRMLGFLDGQSSTNYSSRGANALSCVADQSPENYLPYLQSLFNAQNPKDAGGEGVQEGGKGLSDKKLASMAVDAGAPDSVKSCITGGDYRPYVKYGVGTAYKDHVRGTPSVVVDGENWDSTKDTDLTAFVQDKIDAAAKK